VQASLHIPPIGIVMALISPRFGAKAVGVTMQHTLAGLPPQGTLAHVSSVSNLRDALVGRAAAWCTRIQFSRLLIWSNVPRTVIAARWKRWIFLIDFGWIIEGWCDKSVYQIGGQAHQQGQLNMGGVEGRRIWDGWRPLALGCWFTGRISAGVYPKLGSGVAEDIFAGSACFFK
jgi:hypothetical protein